jgi:hypothetical protein
MSWFRRKIFKFRLLLQLHFPGLMLTNYGRKRINIPVMDIPFCQLQEVAEPVPATVFAFLPVTATIAGGIERVPGKLPLTDGTYPVQGGNHLPPVPGLDGMESRHAVGNIFHVPTGNLVPGHLFKAECNAWNPQPIWRICSKRHRTWGPDNRIVPVRRKTIHHTGNAMLIWMHMYIGLGCWSPGIFVAGKDACIEKRSHIGINSWSDGEHLIPYDVRIKGIPQMIGELFADGVPVWFDDWFVFFVIIPDRAGLHPHQFRYCDRFFLLRQDNSSYIR